MWWNDLKHIKEQVNKIEAILESCVMKDDIQDEINSFHDRLSEIREDIEDITKVSLTTKTMDRFDDYMKNVDKLNLMINEVKGVISLARAAIAERKEQAKELEEFKETTKIAKEIHSGMSKFIAAGNNIEQKKFFKLDAIYKAICEKQEKKSPKKKIAPRKKAVPASLSL